SDNRYGVFLSKVPSFFVCHQLTLRSEETPTWLLKAANRKNRKMIQKFDECWVPDYEGDNNLAGDLSKGNLNIPIRYLGALSRFQPLKPCENQTKEKIDILIVLSGPEPQRSILEASLIEQIPNIDRHFTLIQGKPGEVEEHSEANYRIVPFMNSRELQHAFQEASCVISRSGYSSLMDYEALGISRLILLPTPGQPEQEYLGEIWKEKQKAIVQPQKELDLKQALEAVEDLKKTSATFISGEGLSKGVAALKKRLHSLKK
ncbi:MAG: glycosyltransferase, partial [Bacteroidota bacterium]